LRQPTLLSSRCSARASSLLSAGSGGEATAAGGWSTLATCAESVFEEASLGSLATPGALC
jgi:hypothetical protein